MQQTALTSCPVQISKGQWDPTMRFAQQVWAVCARIPRGKVATYGQIAHALGKPKASRAVGMALNRNPYAPQIPCHRVVASDGKLTGYAGGLPEKARLLKGEGVFLPDGDEKKLRVSLEKYQVVW